jgi:DNA-binding response OmpR family regulator
MVKRGLVVEDDEALAEVVTRILYESGITVARVATVADAQVHGRGAPRLPLFPLDLVLPEASGSASPRTCRASDLVAQASGVGRRRGVRQAVERP